MLIGGIYTGHVESIDANSDASKCARGRSGQSGAIQIGLDQLTGGSETSSGRPKSRTCECIEMQNCSERLGQKGSKPAMVGAALNGGGNLVGQLSEMKIREEPR